MIFLPIVVFFAFGLIIGSFLNVVIYRINTKRSLGGRSACMSCQRQLPWHELIPLLSFFALQGRCRACKTKISIQYPLVEFTSGLVFALLFLKFQDIFYSNAPMFAVLYAFYAVIFSILLVIATYDLKHKIIPDSMSLIFGILAFAGLFLFNASGESGSYVFSPHIPSVLDFLSGIFIAFPFAFFWFISGGRWMGLGDAKLALGIGWLLPIPLALSSLVMAFWSGAIIGILLVVLSKKGKMNDMGMKSEIPFAPFLVLGAIAAFFLEFNFFGI